MIPASLPPAALPLVLALVGTDHHPFRRLVGWTDRWYAGRPPGSVEALVQHGASPPPARAPGRPFVPRDELDALLRRAAVVVCHGGPSTIVEARRAGVVPIVVARSGALGEHVDDHQRRFAGMMAGRGLIALVDDEEALHAAVDAALLRPLRTTGDAHPDPSEAALRLGRLVDRLTGRR